MSLAEKHCTACVSATVCMTENEYGALAEQIPKWSVKNGHSLVRTFKLKNFKQALELANRIGEIAEDEGHHPDLLVRWGELKVEVWTHKVDGLTEADFVLAAKIDLLV